MSLNKLLLAIICALAFTACDRPNEDRIASLEGKVLALIGDNGRMTAELEDQTAEIDTLKAQIRDLDDRIEEIEADLSEPRWNR